MARWKKLSKREKIALKKGAGVAQVVSSIMRRLGVRLYTAVEIYKKGVK